VQIIDNHNQSQPMFLMVSHLAGHAGRGGIEPGVPDADSTNTKYLYISDPRRAPSCSSLRYYFNLSDSEIVNLLDQSMGTVVKRLAERNMLENSIVLFFSVNGAHIIGDYGNTGSNSPLRGVRQLNQKLHAANVVLSDLNDAF
jgi:arylsulfatase B